MTKEEALLKAQNICAQQEKCESDIRKKLLDWKIDPLHVDEVIENLKETSFISDERYALFFAKEKFNFNKWGKIKIEYSLKNKQINSALIQKALEKIPEEDYELTLQNQLQKKLKGIKDTDVYVIKSKLARYALSKGFESGKVFDMISEILEK
ncbi:MAG: RecX family transcriptional regulator [Bacteroidales bacterium]|nr:RecX family transcriptional regulator [Bacteroidales bacterium]